MDIWEFLVLLLVAAICGAVAQAITGFSRGGLLVAIAVGFIGALFGIWIQRQTGAPEIFAVQIGQTTFPIIWSIFGLNVCKFDASNSPTNRRITTSSYRRFSSFMGCLSTSRGRRFGNLDDLWTQRSGGYRARRS